MQADFTFEDHRRLLTKLAGDVVNRSRRAGAASVQFDDVFQEMCVAWCIARDRWSAERGVPFIPYLINGVRQHVNRWIDYEIMIRSKAIDLDDSNSEDGENELHNIIPDECSVDPIDLIDQKERLEFQQYALSPNARTFVRLLRDPPVELHRIVDGARARREYAVSRGVNPSPAMTRITEILIFDVMGLSLAERRAVREELRAFATLETMIDDWS